MRSMLVVAAAALAAVLRIEDAAACSCAGPSERLLGPDRAIAAPLNARVRLEVPGGSWARGGSKKTVLRVSAGANVDTTRRTIPDGDLDLVELMPSKPLLPGTRYEVAIVATTPDVFPSITVLGTFETGTTADTTAPKLAAGVVATAHGNAHANGGDCSIHGPWIDLAPIRAEDPGRPDARLMYAVWLGDTGGSFDTTKPPTALVDASRDTVTVGKRSLCDPHGFAIPQGQSFVHLAIAAVDEAGNTSPIQKTKADMRSVPKPVP